MLKVLNVPINIQIVVKSPCVIEGWCTKYQLSVPQIGFAAEYKVVMYNSFYRLSWYYYCDIRLYYCDVRLYYCYVRYHDSIRATFVKL